MITVCHYSNDAERRKAAQKYLQQIKSVDNRIKSLIEEAEALQDKALSIRTTQTDRIRVQTSNRGEAHFVGYINKKADVEKKVEQELERLFDLKMEVRDVIEQVKDDRCKLLLRYRYLHLLSWDDIQEKLHIGERRVFIIHKMALSLVADILDSREAPISV